MPGRDATGPNGKGPRTGRGLGGCKSNDNAKIQTPRRARRRRNRGK